MSEQKFDVNYFGEVFENNNIVIVTFTKKDGSERVMKCTKSMDLIPPDKHPKPLAEGEEPKPVSDVVCNVWDLEKGGWRSFRYDSVISVKLPEE